MDSEHLRKVNCKVMEEAIRGLQNGFNHEDWNVFSQALDNEMHICAIEESSVSNEMEIAFKNYEAKRDEHSLNKLMDTVSSFMNDMKGSLRDSERTQVKNRLKTITDQF